MTKEITGWKDELKGALEEMGNVPARRFYDIMEKFINHQIASAVEARTQEIIELSDKIEGENSTEFNEWRAFKGFRNTLRDKYIINPSKE